MQNVTSCHVDARTVAKGFDFAAKDSSTQRYNTRSKYKKGSRNADEKGVPKRIHYGIVPTSSRKIGQRVCNRIKKPPYSLLHKPVRSSYRSSLPREAEPLPGLPSQPSSLVLCSPGTNLADRIRHRPAFRLSEASILAEFTTQSWV